MANTLPTPSGMECCLLIGVGLTSPYFISISVPLHHLSSLLIYSAHTTLSTPGSLRRAISIGPIGLMSVTVKSSPIRQDGAGV
jgi:hypothetical protein